MSADMGEDVFGRLFLGDPPATDPYPLYEQLRALGPLVPVGSHTWLTTSYGLSSRVLRDQRFHNDVDRAGRARGGADWRERPALRTLAGMLLMANPPRHTALREVLVEHFRPRSVARLRAKIETRVTALCDALAARGESDFITAFAEVLPRWVVSEFIGIPMADRVAFREQTLAFNAVFERRVDFHSLAGADAAAEEIERYVLGLVDNARHHARGDLISTLVAASDAGRLPLEEVVRLVFQVYNASFQTVLGLLGNGLIALLDHPQQLAVVRSNPTLMEQCVAEMLRYDPPVQSTGRYAVTALELAGARVAKGDLVVTVLAAANRDPDRYPRAHMFEPSRPQQPSLAFGYGAHYCVGAALANLQGTAAFRGLLRLDIEPRGPAVLHPGANMRSRASVPIKIRRRVMS